jgi:DNA-binding response OmpR family regulator
MRILIVDDEESLAKALKKNLEEEGYAVDYLTDGFKASQRIPLYPNEYDLIILDLMMPGLSGLELCRYIRAKGIHIPILILTARDMVTDKVNLLKEGADDYMVKPFSTEELLARVKALLRRPPEAVPITLRIGKLSLDTASRRVYLGEREISLTAKEYALLEYFMRHPDQVLDRERILDHLWDFESTSFSNVVDVHIKNLRKKIDGRRKNQLIETVHGAGYRLRTRDLEE